jgi:hypothetical protein
MGRQRVDYFPSGRALEMSDSLRSPYTPARDPIIDKIIREWAVHGLRSDHEAAIDRFWDGGLSIVGLARSASQGIVVVRAVACYLTVNTLSRRSTRRSSGRARLPISQHPGVEPRCGGETPQRQLERMPPWLARTGPLSCRSPVASQRQVGN